MPLPKLKETDIEKLITAEDYLANFHLRLIGSKSHPEQKKSFLTPDLITEMTFENSVFRFAVEILTSNHPKEFFRKIMQVSSIARDTGAMPMIVLPFASDELLDIAFKNGVSCLDLCGNGMIYVPDRLLIRKSGKKNIYPDSRPIKNIYRGDSSIVPRLFLDIPKFESLKHLHSLLRYFGAKTALSTVSKVVAQLENDLIVARQERELKVMQPHKLLDYLQSNYRAPLIQTKFIGRYSGERREILEKIGTTAKNHGGKATLTGYSSALEFATMAQEDVVSLYTNVSLDVILANVKLEEIDRFANIHVLQTNDSFPFFATFGKPFTFPVATASPVQAFLEMSKGDKRQREVAESIKKRILDRALYSKGDFHE